MHHHRVPKHKVLVSPSPVTVLKMKSHGMVLKEADEPIRIIEEKMITQKFK
jgi:hypothetical protein